MQTRIAFGGRPEHGILQTANRHNSLYVLTIIKIFELQFTELERTF